MAGTVGSRSSPYFPCIQSRMNRELLLLFVVLCHNLALGQLPLLPLHSPPLSANKNLTTACQNVLNATLQRDAIKYLDYMGKPGSGIMDGNFQALGDYDGCVEMSDSHYCYARVKVNLAAAQIPMISGGWGLCVPKECGEDDIANGLEEIFAYLSNLAGDANMTNPFSLGSISPDRHVACYKESTYTTGVIITLFITGVLVFLSVAGTMLDSLDRMVVAEEGPAQIDDDGSVLSSDKIVLFYNPSNNDSQRKGGLLREILLCFSILKNSKQLMSTSAPAGSINCINGIRVISMFWVILGHTYAFSFSGNVTDNPLTLFKTIQDFTFEPILNGIFSVDSFFFLSGLLVGYLSWRRMKKNDGKLPLFAFYFHRFWRLTPLYMFVILFYDKMNGFLGQGPVWFNAQSNNPCGKYWWTNLLYINNFYPTGIQDECLDWSWYLANDMQFYVISPIILFAVYRLRWIGLVLTAGGLTLASVIVTAVIVQVYDLNSFLFVAADHVDNYMNYVYIKPYCRIAPYLIGMVLAYVFHMKISLFKRGRTLSWVINICGWVLAALLAVSVVYGPYTAFKVGGTPFTHLQNIFYTSLCRLTWALAIAWVVYSCHYGYGGMVNSFLSASFWTPLSRMTYGAYLVHPIILFALFLSFETPAHYTVHLFVYYFIGATVLSYGVAFVCAVFLELPLTNLEKIVFKM